MTRTQLALLRVALGALCLLALAACTRGYDAVVTNPCPKPLEMARISGRAGQGAADLYADDLRHQRSTLPPASATKIMDAFTDAQGLDWSVVVDPDGRAFTVLVDGDAVQRNVPIVLPATVCT